MKIMKMLKFSSLIAIVFSVAIGCTSTSETGGEQAAKDAIAAAKDAYARADSSGAAWRDTEKMIKDAEKLLSEGKYDEATALANKAREQAEDAIAQQQFEQQRIANKFSSSAAAPVTASAGQYAVVRGDNLWNISAKPDIYNNPYQWPLIYKANSNKIKDADLIYPGQVFDINSNPSAADADAAVRHAKSRGSWSLGAVEDSDKAYLAQ